MQISEVNRSAADRVHAAAIHLLRRLRRQDDAMRLSAARASALSVMVFGGRVTIGQLAQAEQVSAPTMTRLIVGMERDGLVRRAGDPLDGRIVWLEATAKGTRILHEGRRRRVEALAEDISRLSDADRETLVAAADILEQLLRPGTADASKAAALTQAGRRASPRPSAKAGRRTPQRNQ